MLWIQLEALFEVISGAFEVLELQVNHSDLRVCFVVFGVQLDDDFEVPDGLVVLVELVQDLGEAEVRWHALGLQLDAVMEVLLGLLEAARVSELGRKVNACPKMRLVLQEHLLKVINRWLELLSFLVLASKVEMGLHDVLLEFAGNCQVQSNFVFLHGLLAEAAFVEDAGEDDVSFGLGVVDFEGLLQILLRLR